MRPRAHRRVGVVADQGQFLGAVGRFRPGQRRRDIFAVARYFFGIGLPGSNAVLVMVMVIDLPPLGSMGMSALWQPLVAETRTSAKK